jgi:hypothetical protein
MLIPGGIVATVGGLGLRNGLLAVAATLLDVSTNGPEASISRLVLQGICVAGPTCILLLYVVPTWLQARRLRGRLQAEVRASVAAPAERADHDEEQERG